MRTLPLAALPTYDFRLRFFAGQGVGQQQTWAEITHLVTGRIELWYGYRSSSRIGWSAEVQGVRWHETGLGVGRMFRCDMSFYQNGSWSSYTTWFVGVVMPETVTVDYSTNDWRLTVVDAVHFLTRRASPVLVVGRSNILQDASARADSVNQAPVVNDPLEFAGEPSLAPEQAIDGNMATLWVSQKSPVFEPVAWEAPVLPYGISEVWKPSQYYDRGRTMWVELWGHESLRLNLALMTRSGFVHVKDVSFGDVGTDPEPPDYGYAILSYDVGTYQGLWGGATRAPVFEWKNSKPEADLAGSISGFSLQFNADGQGDYLALADLDSIRYYPGGRSHFAWRTWFVVDGPATQRYDYGSFVEVAPDRSWARISTTQSWPANGLAGCFIQAQAGSNAHNKHRFVAGNDATSNGVTKVYFETPWTAGPTPPWTYEPQVGHTYLLHGYPVCTYTNDFPHFWDRAYGVGVNDNQWPYSASYRRKAGFFNYNDLRAWEIDLYPQPGRSGAIGDLGLSWLMVTPREIECYLSQPLQSGQTVARVTGTAGLLPSGSLYIGGYVVQYTAKTADTVALANAWSGAEQPAGTRVYQYESGSATALWPMHTFRIRRKPVPLPDGRLRVISHCWLYGSLLDTPRTPGEDQNNPEAWRADWQNPLSPNGEAIFSVANNEAAEIAFSVHGAPYVRLRHVLVALAMNDGSYGRINEMEIYPPDAVVNESEQNIATAVQFLAWALTQCGVAVVVSSSVNQMPLDTFTTDGSSWSDVLDDYARRTGHIIIAALDSATATVQAAPAWPSAPALAVQDTLDRSNTIRMVRERQDDLSISQVQVKVIGADQASAYGYFPPTPRPYGVVWTPDETYCAPPDQANNIARWLFNRRTQPIFVANLVGPDPLLTPGMDRLLTKYTPFDNDLVVADVRHQVQLDGVRSWTTEVTLERFV